MSGVPEGRRPRATDNGVLTEMIRARRAGPRAVDALRQDIQRDSRLGIGYLGIGAVIVGLILIVRGLVSFGWTWEVNDWLLGSLIGWIVVVLAFGAAVLTARRGRGVLPLWAFAGVLAADSVALALDYIALMHSEPTASYVTVTIGIGATMLACVTFRPTNNVLIAVCGLTVVQLVMLGVLEVSTPGTAALGISSVVLTVAPAFAGIVIVRSFGDLVQRELDRTVAESTISAPRYGLGLLASEELALLDLAAEELLQDVATGRAALPLDKSLSSKASMLATDLRRLLVAGRRETWLKHATTESAVLGDAVVLHDADGLAGYLEPPQRDGLLSALWLIVDESGRYAPRIEVSMGRPSSANGGVPADRMVLPIVLSIDGIPRRRIDPAVWSALSRVGRYSLETRTGRLRVSVDAHVVVPDASRSDL
ncbi:hypothetical protein [Herbiconiux sp. YIM B11900]|uniref:hypothetical protein n=1 Tax=Herbiconiux sp. YIM B11900 TaxID=3404131 RepID=UPI003F83B9A3